MIKETFSFENVCKEMDIINKALYPNVKINGATELSGDSYDDFAKYSDKADVMAEQISEERDEDNIPL